MASSTTKSPVRIKLEPPDSDLALFESNNYERYGTPMASSPTGVDSTTLTNDDTSGNRDSAIFTPTISDPMGVHIAPQGTDDIDYEVNEIAPPHSKRKRLSSDRSGLIPTKSGKKSTPQPKQAYEHYEGPHGTILIKNLNEMRLTGKFVDMTLLVDGKKIPCHKVILCGVSSYFMDVSAATPSDNGSYQVTRTTFEIMLQLVDYCYTSRVKITDDNIQELLSASSHFKFTAIREACLLYLKRKIHISNCLAIEQFAIKESCPKLANDAISFAHENFKLVSKTRDFLELDVERLITFISSDFLNVQQEEMIYNAAIAWVKHDLSAREQQIEQVLERVRMPLLKPQFLLDVVQNDPLVKHNKKCDIFLDEARRFHLLVDQRPLMQSSRTRPRTGYCATKAEEVLVVVGGLDKNKQCIANCSQYRFPDLIHNQIAPLKVPQTAYSVTTVKNNIFVTGGAFSSASNEVWMYVPSLDKWQQVAPLLEARYLHASAGLDGQLFVVGGHTGINRLRSVECYNPDTNTWIPLEPMLESLSSPSAATADRHLYVIGGASGSSPADIVCKVQVYDLRLNTWSYIAPLPQPERGAVTANLNGVIFVMGQHKRVYAYNRQSDKWKKMNHTNAGHLHGAAAVHNGRLYVSGGLHGNSYINGTIEVYDQLTDTWSVIETLHTPVYAQGFVNIVRQLK